MTYSRPAAWAGSLCVLLCVWLVGVGAVAQDPTDSVSKTIRKKVDAQFPGWTLVPAPVCTAGVASAAVTTADIDFDQSVDVAMVVQTPSGAPHVVVAMPRVIGGAIVHDLGPLASVPGATHITVLPQGYAVRARHDMFDNYLSGPTFAAASCEGPLVAFVWTGYSFRPVPVTAR